jgi:hypothetical protein
VLAGFVGQPRWSLANWLALHEPLLIVDEAHNTKTDKSFTALKRLNPSAILELTATPLPAKTNVLYHVSAQELAAEAMIKLPIALAEHPEGGSRRCLRGAKPAQAGGRGAEGRGRWPWLCAPHRAVSGAERERRSAARGAAQAPDR